MIKWFRLFAFFISISVFFLVSIFFSLLPLPPIPKKAIASSIAGFFCRGFLFLFGIHISVIREYPLPAPPHLIVANHLSYVDVLILYGVLPTIFVTSVEVKQTPFLGWLCRLAGCVFVERRNRIRAKADTQMLADILARGVALTLFPEGTSSNGEAVLPFKSAFFETAIQSGAHVSPICINYRAANRKPITQRNRDNFFWYGDMAFFPHLLRLISVRRTDVEVIVGEPIDARGLNRKQLASRCYDSINRHFLPIRS